MSKKGRFNHLAKTLKQSGFYPKDLPLPGRYTPELRDAINAFLLSSKGENVRRVVNAFRNSESLIFRTVGNVNYITTEVRQATENYLAINKDALKAPPANEISRMREWELRGGRASANDDYKLTRELKPAEVSSMEGLMGSECSASQQA